MRQVVQVGVFKARCLEFIRSGQTIIITKNHVPVAELKPIKKKKESLVGCMKGTIQITGDIISPIEEQWDACL